MTQQAISTKEEIVLPLIIDVIQGRLATIRANEDFLDRGFVVSISPEFPIQPPINYLELKTKPKWLRLKVRTMLSPEKN